jgi:colicin import membrane protein
MLMALGVHLLFGLFLFFTVHLHHETPSPYMAELWTEAPAQPIPAPTPAPAPPPAIKAPPAPTPPTTPHADIQLKKAAAKPQPEEKAAPKKKKVDQNELHDEEILKAAAAAKKKTDDAQKAKDAAARDQAQKQSQAQQSRIASFEDAIRIKIRGSTDVPLTVPSGVTLQVRISVLPDGSVVGVRVVNSSGNRAYDEAVLKGIERAQPLPLPNDPELKPKFRDLTLSFTHEKQK